MKILVLNGPNLNLLGTREKAVYGTESYESLVKRIHDWGKEAGAEVTVFQSNHEGELIDRVQEAAGSQDALIINAGGYTHTSIALMDAVKAVELPCVEVHLTDIMRREPFRRVSYVGRACTARFIGLGGEGYRAAIRYLTGMEDEHLFLPCEDLTDGEIRLRLNRTSPACPEKQYVPAYFFDICLADGTRAGALDLRIGQNRKLYIGGHIGYRVEEPFRGHRYAMKAVLLALKQAGKHHMDRVYITCVPENAASKRTIELAGGVFEERAPIPEENEMHAEGKREVLVYRFDLE